MRTGIVGEGVTTGLFARTVAGCGTVTVAWVNTMGVRHADTANCDFPALAPEVAVAGNAALLPAFALHRAAPHQSATASHAAPPARDRTSPRRRGRGTL